MLEEPALPTLSGRLLVSGSEQAFVRPTKRVKLHESSPAISSDPPLFSSDDDPSAENYAGNANRQKRRYYGPWYRHSETLTTFSGRNKRTFERQHDSAVWLGSDGTETDLEVPETRSEPPRPKEHIQYQSSDPPTQHLEASRRIQECLDAGREDINLDGLGLCEIPTAMLKLLQTFVTIPIITKDVPFTTLDPKLRIFLSSNMLRTVPGEIFNIETISVLSLRHNPLVELPSAIGKMRQLVELNLTFTSLGYLPFELIELVASGQLRNLHIFPNNFYQPKFPDGAHESPERYNDSHPDHSDEWGACAFHYTGRSRVRFLDVDGLVLKGPVLPRDDTQHEHARANFFVRRHQRDLAQSTSSPSSKGQELHVVEIAPIDDIPIAPSRSRGSQFIMDSRASSLHEISLRAWTKFLNTAGDTLPRKILENDALPTKIVGLLDHAWQLRNFEGGDRRCTICDKVFIIPRTEWIEWWEMPRRTAPLAGNAGVRDSLEYTVPFIRRGCSWKCIPRQRPV